MIEIDDDVKSPVKKKTGAEKKRDKAFTRYARAYRRVWTAEPSHYEWRDPYMVIFINNQPQPGATLRRLADMTKTLNRREL